MRRSTITGLCGVALCGAIASTAFASLPPGRPDYLFGIPEKEWIFAERLWRDNARCTAALCEAGYHDGDFILSLDRQADRIRILSGFRSCERPSWNDVDLTDTPRGDRTAVVRYLAKALVRYAAEQCGLEAPDVELPEMSLLFP
jgi:hypothetical protein